jgi:hypothetical protein
LAFRQMPRKHCCHVRGHVRWLLAYIRLMCQFGLEFNAALARHHAAWDKGGLVFPLTTL